MTAPAPSTMRRDIASAYLAAATKIGSWVVISAIVYRWYGAAAFAMVSLARGALSILNYATLGLPPAIIRLLALAKSEPTLDVPLAQVAEPRRGSFVLSYAHRVRWSDRVQPIHTILASGIAMGLAIGVSLTILVALYANHIHYFHEFPTNSFYWWGRFGDFVYFLGFGMVLRLCSDIPGAVLQTSNLIGLDNLCIAASDVLWIYLAMKGLQPNGPYREIVSIGLAYRDANALLLGARLLIAIALVGPLVAVATVRASVMRALLGFGGFVALAQLADYLYAPIDFVLINRLLDPLLTAVYSPAVQIDAGLLLLVGGVASVLLPKTAIAHAAGNRELIRRYYIHGTLFTGGLLACAAIAVWILSPRIFHLWLHDPMTATQVILPLVLIHTVVGGSSAVGRSILLGMGKVKPFAIAVLSAGVSNVILSYCFVRFFGLGLKGIILGTIVVVIARCAIWQPWYVLRTLKEPAATLTASPENAQTKC